MLAERAQTCLQRRGGEVQADIHEAFIKLPCMQCTAQNQDEGCPGHHPTLQGGERGGGVCYPLLTSHIHLGMWSSWPYGEGGHMGRDAGVSVLMAPLCPCFSHLSVKAQDWAGTAPPSSRLDTQIVGLGVLPVYGWYALSCTRKTSQAPGRSTHTHARPSVNTNKI